MKIIIGYGNKLRGEDSFGLDVIKELRKVNLSNTHLMSLFQLTPELSLDLLEADEIIFIDTQYSSRDLYALASDIKRNNDMSLSHHISYLTIIDILNSLYNKYPKYEIYSILSNNFEQIKNTQKYYSAVDQVASYLISMDKS